MSHYRGINRWHVSGFCLPLVVGIVPLWAQTADPTGLDKANNVLRACAVELYGGSEPQPGTPIPADSLWNAWRDCQLKEPNNGPNREADTPNAVLTKRLLLIGKELYGSNYKSSRMASNTAETQIKDFLVQIWGMRILESDNRPQAVRAFLEAGGR